MCSTHLRIQSMENYQGDLADIFRASGGNTSSGDHLPVRSPVHHMVPDWEMFHHSSSDDDHPILNYPSQGMESPPPNFGHPFNSFRDPLLEDLDMSTPGYFIPTTAAAAAATHDAAAARAYGQKIVVDDNDIIKSDGQPHPSIINNNHNHNRNIFSRMLQISPNNATTSKLPLSPPCDHRGILKAPTSSSSSSLILTNDILNANTSSKGCLVENNALQISSPRNTGIKRRKSMAKKVVCIPAPAPANSRPTGEVVPSDLWAWRKYGQKPIKGSPYPRGYYRCSSSKGCSARKQVERSRTDPNMLVITYTSEHNHPWPTQRNALAGSTRNQPSKNNIMNSAKSTSPPAAPASQGSQKGSLASLKEEPNDVKKSHESGTMNYMVSPPATVFGNSMTADHVDAMVKEENIEEFDKEMEMDGGGDGDDDQMFSSSGHEGFPHSYRPVLPAETTNQQQPEQDFFADLGEIEADHPLNLLFTHGFDDEREDNKSLDPFSFYDWAAAAGNHHINSTTPSSSSYGVEAKRPEGL